MSEALIAFWAAAAAQATAARPDKETHMSTLHLPCRFTDRYLAVKPHGSGVRLTIETTDLGADGVERPRHLSVFLNAREMHSLYLELGIIGGEETSQLAQPSGRDSKVEDALRNLTAALIGAGY